MERKTRHVLRHTALFISRRVRCRAGGRASELTACWLGPKSKYNTHSHINGGEQSLSVRILSDLQTAFLQSPPHRTLISGNQCARGNKSIEKQQCAQLFPFAAPHNSIKRRCRQNICLRFTCRVRNCERQVRAAPGGICMLLGCRLRAEWASGAILAKPAWLLLSRPTESRLSCFAQIWRRSSRLPQVSLSLARRYWRQMSSPGSQPAKPNSLARPPVDAQLKICGRRSARRRCRDSAALLNF